MAAQDNGWATRESALEQTPPTQRQAITDALLAQAIRAAALSPAFEGRRNTLAQTGPANAGRTLQSLPVQTRQELTNRLTDYQVPQPFPLRSVFTSGSTGRSLEVRRTPVESQIENDFVRYAWQRMNLPADAKGASLTGRTFPDGDHLIDRNGFQWISCYLLNTEIWERVSRLLSQHERDYVRGYGSLVGEYFSAVHRSEVSPPVLKAVAYSSDMLLPRHREAILAVTGIVPFGIYGSVERALMAVSCEASDAYHVLETYGTAEILDEMGSPIIEPDIVRDLVGSSLWPRATTIIRYATGDSAAWVDGTCECGRTQRRFRLVAGRTRDVLVDINGESHILGPSIYEPIFRILPADSNPQFSQLETGKLVVRLHRTSAEFRAEAYRLLCSNLGELFSISVVDEEPIRTAAGKRLLLERPTGTLASSPPVDGN